MAPKFLKSVHVPHRKNTKNSVPQRFFEVKSVTIPMSMHIGAPAKPVVKVGDHVENGGKITEGAINPKKLLDTVRLLCRGKKEPILSLCRKDRCSNPPELFTQPFKTDVFTGLSARFTVW